MTDTTTAVEVETTETVATAALGASFYALIAGKRDEAREAALKQLESNDAHIGLGPVDTGIKIVLDSLEEMQAVISIKDADGETTHLDAGGLTTGFFDAINS